MGLSLLSAWSGPGRAADSDGQFAALGAGTATCQRFLDAREARSDEYFLFGGWLEGYLSARNQTADDTFTLVPWQSVDVLAGFLAQHCRRNPDERFLNAVATMTAALHPQRLEQSSERVVVAVGLARQEFFRATLARLQLRLRQEGLYEGPAEGDFDQATAAAVQAFQSREGLQATGFPDQLTLYKLFF
jgi:hypothetical protein